MKRLILLASTVLLATVVARGEDWPHWLGPRADGISKETGMLEKWPEAGPKEVWSTKAGIGFSSPVAVDGKVYLFTLEDKSKEVLTAYEAATGKVLWTQSYDGGWTDSGKFPGTRATPWIEEGRIYTYGGASDLVCRNLADGKEIWHLNVVKQTSTPGFQTWGVAGNPLIIGNAIYVQGGNGGPIAVAVDKNSGKIIWQSQARGMAGYASITQIDIAGTKQLIVFAGKEVIAMAPADGKTIWTYPWTTDWDVNAATPVYRDGYLLLTSGYKSGSLMLKVSPTAAQKVFENRMAAGNMHVKSRFQPVILDGDNLYVNSEGAFRCMSWPDGKIKWQAKTVKPGMGGGMLRVGDKMIILNDKGTLILAKAGPEGAEQISSVKLAEGDQNWATPLLYNGRLYVKTMEKFYCLDVSGK